MRNYDPVLGATYSHPLNGFDVSKGIVGERFPNI